MTREQTIARRSLFLVMALFAALGLAGATEEQTARAAKKSATGQQTTERRYLKLEEILDDLHLNLGRANGNGALQHFQPQIDAAFEAWPEIAQQFPKEAQAFERARREYLVAYNLIKQQDYQSAELVINEAFELRNRAAKEIAEADSAEQYGKESWAERYPEASGNSTSRRPPLRGGAARDEDKLPDYQPPVSVKPSVGVQAGVSGGSVQGSAEEEYLKTAWDPWVRKIFAIVGSFYRTRIDDHRRYVGALFPKKPCIITFTIRKHPIPGGYLYNLVDSKVTQSSGSEALDTIALLAVGDLANQNRNPDLAFPAGIRANQKGLQMDFTLDGVTIYKPNKDVEINRKP